MLWDNGITYTGHWRDGKFHGKGAKMYSRGGGYRGDWVEGRRQGAGCMIFAGKFGYDRWEGPFADDTPHGIGVMFFPEGTQGAFAFSSGKPQPKPGGAGVGDGDHYSDQQCQQFEGPVSALDDGSPSTAGIGGVYSGSWDHATGRPHGYGVMRWSNGIEYKGMWAQGKYHGHGRKLYSRGGGYEGPWAEGKREGHGVSFFGVDSALGRRGVLRWEGPFVDDKPHGEGQAYVQADAEEEDEHGRWSGDLAVKGPVVEFGEGLPVAFP
jgi:hypothetical protein